jgi:hypothetical protein
MIKRAGYCLLVALISFACIEKHSEHLPGVTLVAGEKFHFNSFVDCNMAEVWIADTFRIFPGKYGEDPLWGYSRDLKFTSGKNADEVFKRKSEEFVEPVMPPNVAPTAEGLHGAVWFETVYQDVKDSSGKTLYAVYHNENYPATLPFNEKTGNGYINKYWPQGLTGPETPAAVCRIGIMKSINGGHRWENKGIFIEDLQPRMILKPHNTAITFAGGVGDPSAVVSGDYLYLFYGEYGYADTYDSLTYDAAEEYSGQCISVARIAVTDLDNPIGKGKRWSANGFESESIGIGTPIRSIQIPLDSGGGAASKASSKFYWGPSVSWNTYLNAWVMLMARAEGPSWKGGRIYISFNLNKDLGDGNNSQQWSTPKLLLEKPGHTIWYPSLQPTASQKDIEDKSTCLKLGKKARLFYKDMFTSADGKFMAEYVSEYTVDFNR